MIRSSQIETSATVAKAHEGRWGRSDWTGGARVHAVAMLTRACGYAVRAAARAAESVWSGAHGLRRVGAHVLRAAGRFGVRRRAGALVDGSGDRPRLGLPDPRAGRPVRDRRRGVVAGARAAARRRRIPRADPRADMLAGLRHSAGKDEPELERSRVEVTASGDDRWRWNYAQQSTDGEFRLHSTEDWDRWRRCRRRGSSGWRSW